MQNIKRPKALRWEREGEPRQNSGGFHYKEAKTKDPGYNNLNIILQTTADRLLALKCTWKQSRQRSANICGSVLKFITLYDKGSAVNVMEKVNSKIIDTQNSERLT